MGLGRWGRFAEFNASELGGLVGFNRCLKMKGKWVGQNGDIKTRVSLGGSY